MLSLRKCWQAGVRKKKVGTSSGKLFDMCDHYFRKKDGFLWQIQSSLPTPPLPPPHTHGTSSAWLKSWKQLPPRKKEALEPLVSPWCEVYEERGQGLSNTGIWSHLVKDAGFEWCYHSKGMATYPSTLAWRTSWAEETGGVHGLSKSQTWLSNRDTLP